MQEAVGAAARRRCPRRTRPATIAMSATAGKVALVTDARRALDLLDGLRRPRTSSVSARRALRDGADARASPTRPRPCAAAGADTDDNAADFTVGGPEPAERGRPAPSVVSSEPGQRRRRRRRPALHPRHLLRAGDDRPDGFGLACGGDAAGRRGHPGGPTPRHRRPGGRPARGSGCTLTIAATPPTRTGAPAIRAFSTPGLRLRIHDIQGAAHRSPYADRSSPTSPAS